MGGLGSNPAFYRPQRVVVGVNLGGDAGGTHLHVRHIPPHKIKIVLLLDGCVVSREVVPYLGARVVEIDSPVAVIILAAVELVTGQGTEDPAHLLGLGDAVVAPAAAGLIYGEGLGVRVYFQAPVGRGHGGRGGFQALPVEVVD